MTTDILKIGLAVTRDDGRILLVRKRGTRMFILPGGKPEGSESQSHTIRREIREELGCECGGLIYHQSFVDKAANEPGLTVTIELWEGLLRGAPAPRNEIDELLWYGEMDPPRPDIAPSLVNQILPYVFEHIVA